MKNETQLKKGQAVELKPEWQDAGDNEFNITVLEDRGDRVLVVFLKEGESKRLASQECIKKSMIVEPLETAVKKAHEFYSDEHTEYGVSFDHAACIEDIHRIFGLEVSKRVNNDIAKDMPELNLPTL